MTVYWTRSAGRSEMKSGKGSAEGRRELRECERGLAVENEIIDG